jgi:hypothetical protein
MIRVGSQNLPFTFVPTGFFAPQKILRRSEERVIACGPADSWSSPLSFGRPEGKRM